MDEGKVQLGHLGPTWLREAEQGAMGWHHACPALTTAGCTPQESRSHHCMEMWKEPRARWVGPGCPMEQQRHAELHHCTVLLCRVQGEHPSDAQPRSRVIASLQTHPGKPPIPSGSGAQLAHRGLSWCILAPSSKPLLQSSVSQMCTAPRIHRDHPEGPGDPSHPKAPIPAGWGSAGGSGARAGRCWPLQRSKPPSLLARSIQERQERPAAGPGFLPGQQRGRAAREGATPAPDTCRLGFTLSPRLPAHRDGVKALWSLKRLWCPAEGGCTPTSPGMVPWQRHPRLGTHCDTSKEADGT